MTHRTNSLVAAQQTGLRSGWRSATILLPLLFRTPS